MTPSSLAHAQPMSVPSHGRLVRLVAACPPILVAALIVKLWLTGTLGFYINARTVWIVLLGGALFLAVGTVSVRRAWFSEHEPGPSWRTVVFMAPVLVGLLVPAHPLSALSGQSASLGSLQLTSHVAGGPAGDQFGTWISDLSAHPAPNWWVGQRATLVGFVARQSGMPARTFIVGRYLVTCCVVDATLLGFPVRLESQRLPPEGAWVQVAGTFGRHYWTDPSGAQYPVIEHAHLSPVSVPSSPYLSP